MRMNSTDFEEIFAELGQIRKKARSILLLAAVPEQCEHC